APTQTGSVTRSALPHTLPAGPLWASALTANQGVQIFPSRLTRRRNPTVRTPAGVVRKRMPIMSNRDPVSTLVAGLPSGATAARSEWLKRSFSALPVAAGAFSTSVSGAARDPVVELGTGTMKPLVRGAAPAGGASSASAAATRSATAPRSATVARRAAPARIPGPPHAVEGVAAAPRERARQRAPASAEVWTVGETRRRGKTFKTIMALPQGLVRSSSSQARRTFTSG